MLKKLGNSDSVKKSFRNFIHLKDEKLFIIQLLCQQASAVGCMVVEPSHTAALHFQQQCCLSSAIFSNLVMFQRHYPTQDWKLQNAAQESENDGACDAA